MSFIVFLGCDGSGKSAVIGRLEEDLRARGVPVTTGHWRPRFPNSSSASALAAAEDPHGGAPRGLPASVLKLGWIWLNWWVAWFAYLRRDRARGVVLFDRYHGDLVVDPRRYRYGGPRWLGKMAARLMPQPDWVVFLDAPPEVLLARKNEVGREALERSRAGYQAHCQKLANAVVVDASQSLDAVVAEVARRTGIDQGTARE